MIFKSEMFCHLVWITLVDHVIRFLLFDHVVLLGFNECLVFFRICFCMLRVGMSKRVGIIWKKGHLNFWCIICLAKSPKSQFMVIYYSQGVPSKLFVYMNISAIFQLKRRNLPLLLFASFSTYFASSCCSLNFVKSHWVCIEMFKFVKQWE